MYLRDSSTLLVCVLCCAVRINIICIHLFISVSFTRCLRYTSYTLPSTSFNSNKCELSGSSNRSGSNSNNNSGNNTYAFGLITFTLALIHMHRIAHTLTVSLASKYAVIYIRHLYVYVHIFWMCHSFWRFIVCQPIHAKRIER